MGKKAGCGKPEKRKREGVEGLGIAGWMWGCELADVLVEPGRAND